MSNKVTIYDIANACGCSTATVSLVINNDPRVKESTRQRVLECMKRMNYNPSYLASSLASKRTNNIGIVIPSLRNPVFGEMIEGAEDYLHSEKYNVIIGCTNQNLEKEKHYLDFISHSKIDGLILFPTFLNELNGILDEVMRIGFPMVICGVSAGDYGISYVTSNALEGAFLATESLIKKGHKNICFVSAAVNEEQADARLNGYKKALDVYGVSFKPEYVLKLSPDMKVIKDTCYSFLGEHPEVTAFFCLYDYIAIAVMKGIYDRGLRIPDDIAVVGYDDIEINNYLPVELTSVHTNSYEVGELAARVIVKKIKENDNEVQQIVLPPKLVERASSNRVIE